MRQGHSSHDLRLENHAQSIHLRGMHLRLLNLRDGKVTLPTVEIISAENARAWVSMVLYLKKK